MPSDSDRASPASAEEAAHLFREAAASGASVSIEQPGGDIVVSTSRMNRILEHEAGDLTCVVEPGLRLSELNAKLAQHGQILPLDPPGDPTLGACIGGALSGPRRHRFGSTRDLLLGVTVVLTDGTVASSGGKVVKNVAGYDLAKLFCGSRGTLGLVVRAAFRLHPIPEAARTLVVNLDDAGTAARLSRTCLRGHFALSAADLLWPGRLALLLEGSERAVEVKAQRAGADLDAQTAHGPVLDESRERQGRARGRTDVVLADLEGWLSGVPEAVVRLSAGVAYVPSELPRASPPALEALRERIRAEFDPARVLVA